MMIKSDRIRRWFGYSRRERQGTYLLSVILLLVLTARLSGVLGPGKESDGGVTETVQPADTLQPFIFDPNSAAVDELVSLGLSMRQATTVDNYRKAGGQFRKPEDFRKIYGIDSSLRERLIPFIHIAEAPEGNEDDAATGRAGKRERAGGGNTATTHYTGDGIHDSLSYQKRESGVSREEELPFAVIELNSADSLLLKSLPGIGDVLSVRIVKYRNLLGGFVSVSQLGEVYGIDSMLVDKLRPLLVADITLIRAVDINNAGYGDLLRHPYISEMEASGIIRYRNRVGTIGSVSELVINRIIDRNRYEKLLPYLKPAGDTTHLR
jgi:DNA uptake protein ComE-like DNA-binding protein